MSAGPGRRKVGGLVRGLRARLDVDRLRPQRSLTSYAVAAAFLEAAAAGLVAPLLPGLIDAGVLHGREPELLVAAYPFGMVVASIPAGLLSARAGSRLIAGVGLCLVAAAFAVLAIATTGWLLIASRLLQGMGGGVAWVGAVGWYAESSHRSHRGATLAVVIAASFVGTLAGPLLGAAAAAMGKSMVFLPCAVVAVGLLLLAPPLDASARVAQQVPMFVRAHRSAGVGGGHVLVAVTGLVTGATAIAAPLLLANHGAGAGLIAGTFIIASIAQTLATRAVGRTGDRFGSLIPALVIAALGATALMAAAVSEQLPLAVMGLALGTCAGLSLWTPGGLLLSLAFERAGVTQGLAVAAMNTTFGLGAAAGASVLPALVPDGDPASVVALGAAALAVTSCGIGAALCAGARA